MNICNIAGEASNRFEICNTELKRMYLLKNIYQINEIMKETIGFSGSFGTGYPFYVLDNNLNGNLTIIKEQLRYNKELIDETKDNNSWYCENCLNINYMQMPDLKQICKPCPQVNDNIKPRKVINRLPDVDMWMICKDELIDEAKEQLLEKFNKCGMYTSDVNPVAAINEINEISLQLEKGIMPEKFLPLDVHIIEYSKISNLLDVIPISVFQAVEVEQIPYLPIHPLSLRKTWQYDDTAYNFVLDYLFSLTPFDFEYNLENKLTTSREIIYKLFSIEDLIDIFNLVSSPMVQRRFKNKEIEDCYVRRLEKWKK